MPTPRAPFHIALKRIAYEHRPVGIRTQIRQRDLEHLGVRFPQSDVGGEHHVVKIVRRWKKSMSLWG